ncbi:MAG TPA: hypothetical protein VNY08_14410, partial [Bradyrhizobium sp.]|nr:hypothetical protein [Bradyrhizobium sp.]
MTRLTRLRHRTARPRNLIPSILLGRPASGAKRRVDADQHHSNESVLGCKPFYQKEEQMKPLSEQLAELSVRAKGAEDAFEGAKKEARDKIEARKAEALSAAKTAVEKVNQQ